MSATLLANEEVHQNPVVEVESMEVQQHYEQYIQESAGEQKRGEDA